jgi:hypothetical protein
VTRARKEWRLRGEGSLKSLCWSFKKKKSHYVGGFRVVSGAFINKAQGSRTLFSADACSWHLPVRIFLVVGPNVVVSSVVFSLDTL